MDFLYFITSTIYISTIIQRTRANLTSSHLIILLENNWLVTYIVFLFNWAHTYLIKCRKRK